MILAIKQSRINIHELQKLKASFTVFFDQGGISFPTFCDAA